MQMITIETIQLENSIRYNDGDRMVQQIHYMKVLKLLIG